MIGLLALALASFPTEHHWSICEVSPKAVLEKVDAEISQSHSYATQYWDNEMYYHRRGVIIRTRNSDGDLDTTVKISVPSPSDIGASWFQLEGFKCEWDAFPEKETLHCSLTEETRANKNQKLPALSESQLRLVMESKHFELDLDRLRPSPEIETTEWKLKSPDGKHVLTRYRWGRRQILELSSREFDVLPDQNIRLCPEQISKTEQVLKSFR